MKKSTYILSVLLLMTVLIFQSFESVSAALVKKKPVNAAGSTFNNSVEVEIINMVDKGDEVKLTCSIKNKLDHSIIIKERDLYVLNSDKFDSDIQIKKLSLRNLFINQIKVKGNESEELKLVFNNNEKDKGPFILKDKIIASELSNKSDVISIEIK